MSVTSIRYVFPGKDSVMALQAILDSLEGLPDAVKTEYKEADGKFVLDVTPVNGWALEDVKGLKSALSAERASAGDSAKKLEAFGDLDPVVAREAIAKRDEYDSFDPTKKIQEQVQSRVTQIVDKHNTETGKLTAERDTLRGQLERTLIGEAAAKAISAAKGSVDLLSPHVERMSRIRQDADSNQVFVEVLDSKGVVRITPTGSSTDPMTISELVEEMRGSEQFARAFDGTGAKGSGATGGGKPPAKSTGSTTVGWGDQEALNSNIEKIASGEVTVVSD